MVASFHLVATLLALAAAFLSVSAQTIPACSQACAVNATRSAGCGGFTNLGCVCNSKTFFTNAGVCTLENCDSTEIAQAFAALTKLCSSYATTTYTLPASLTSTISIRTVASTTTSTSAITSSSGGGAVSFSSSGSAPTTSTSSRSSKSGAAVPGAKVTFGSSSTLVVIFGGVLFGAFAVGL